jgi:hypothetical protein
VSTAALSGARHTPLAEKGARIFHAAATLPLWLRVTCVWLLVMLASSAARWSLMLSPVWLADNDDVLRLIQVHDWLAGQGWFDLVQYRLDPPAGGSIHWSRLADLGIAVPMVLARFFTTADWADRIAIIVYPGVILLTVMWIMARTARRLLGEKAVLPALFVTLTAGSMLMQMLPGRIDHHGLQILFMVVLLSQLLHPQKWRSGLVAGLMMALSLGVGLETLAYVAVAQVALWWLWGRRSARTAFVSGTGFGLLGGSALVFFGTLASTFWQVPIHDAFGRAHAAALAGGGLCWIVLAHVDVAGLRQRLIAGAGAGGAVVAILVLVFPELTQAPYARLDPFLKYWFMDNVLEAAPLYKYARETFAGAVMDGVFGLTAVGLALFAIWSEKTAARRDGWIVVTLLLVTAFGIALMQVRAFAFVGAFAILPCVAMITRVRLADNMRPLAIACVWIFCSMPGAGIIAQGAALVAGKPVTSARPDADATACLTRTDIAPLNALPKGVMVNPIDLGMRILGYSHHAVLASPFHRVQRGMRDSVRTYLSPPATAEKIVRARQADYIIYCPLLPETDIFLKGAPHGLLSDLHNNKVPDWLVQIPMPKGNPLKVYRVVKAETRR